MGVVHEGAGAACHKFIDKGFASRNRGLVEPAHPVHAVGQALAVPVDGGVLGQAVGDEDAHAVALDHFDGGPGALAVVAPHVHHEAGRHLTHYGLGHQVELFHARVHAPGGGPAVECDHGVVGAARGWVQWRCGVGAGLHGGLGQRSHGHAADGSCGHSRGRAGEEIAAVHVSGLEGLLWLRYQMPSLARRPVRCL